MQQSVRRHRNVTAMTTVHIVHDTNDEHLTTDL